MKLQYLTVIFVIIFLPIILVTTYYVHNQMETIRNQLEYDANLLDATHDAMAAFEINTANEDLSAVSDSLRSIIEASNNIFLNTLAINFGISNASKSYVQPYIPAILYSLYDGYYIYSPTNTPIVCTDKYGQTISTDSYGVRYKETKTYTTNSGKTVEIGIYEFDQDAIVYPTDSVTSSGGPQVSYSSLPNAIKSEYGQMLYENEDGTYSTVIHTEKGSSYNTKYKISYMLKSYVPYAVTYKDEAPNLNVTINYTLDNYMTVLGDIGGIYYSKSGYLINDDLIESITVNGNLIEWYTYSDEQLESIAKNPSEYEVVVKFNADKNGNVIQISNKENYNGEYWKDAQDAVSYYSRAWAFSKWIYSTEGLKNLRESNVVTSVYDLVNENIDVKYHNVEGITENLLYDFSVSDNLIFEGNPEDDESNFNEHKRHAIRNSITYNLCLAMTAYNEKYTGMTFEMPVLSDTEWDKILSNVSILTFMQGLNCGLKLYNNYALVCSNNNEISVTPEEIYYTDYTVSMTDGDKDYTGDGVIDGSIETVHRINCPKLNNTNYYTSLKSKEIKYDKSYNSVLEKYDYDHKVYTCYDCLVNPNYIGITGNKNGLENLVDSIVNADEVGVEYLNKLKAYYIAVGKERENLYKPTAVAENSAIEIFNFPTPVSGYNVKGDETVSLPDGKKSTYNINRISKIEITLEDTTVNAGVKNLYTTSLVISLNNNSSLKYNQVVLPTTSKVTRTLELSGNFSNESKLQSIKFDLGSEEVKFNVKSIKIYYK